MGLELLHVLPSPALSSTTVLACHIVANYGTVGVEEL
jgi:hypothetical protein